MNRMLGAILPGGLLLLAALVFLRPGALPDSMLPYVRVFPYIVAGIGVLLGWLFNRSRIVFAIVVLALADRALVQRPPGDVMTPGVAHVLFETIAILLPLNLGGFAMISERGILNLRGVARLVPILVQCLVIAFFFLFAPRVLAAWVDHKFLDVNLASWAPVSQPALLAFGLALVAQGIRVAWHRSAIDGAFLWALAASFVALHTVRAGWLGTNYFATAGLILVVALFETSYRMAYHDDLTGLPGRRALNEALQKLGNRYVVAMVDIDHFKPFNDQYGHDVGDQALRMVASKLERVSGGGKAFRYGGEEFTVVFPGQSLDDVIPHLESLRKSVQTTCFVLRAKDRPRKKPKTPRPQRSPRRAVVVTVSIGVGERNNRNTTPDQVIRAADKALYQAKGAGRNQVSA
jgi:diguanylate cyclase (GGDEF)-like protein